MTVATQVSTVSKDDALLAEFAKEGQAKPLFDSWAPADPWLHFIESAKDEPHCTRRKVILSKHKEIRKLFGNDPRTALYVLVWVSIQFYCISWARHLSWPVFFALAYVVGGTLNHGLFLLNHDLSHHLCWSKPWANYLTSIVAGFPSGVPANLGFYRYHMIHHQQQGVKGVDMDVPSDLEIKIFQNLPFRKLIWVFCQPFFYALRPVFNYPLPVTGWVLFGALSQVAFNTVVVATCGMAGLGYMLASSLLGMGLHPCAGHFIAEHYTFLKEQETYSYYGIVNYPNFNVGYHQEHHDFPKVPWTRLPQVKAMAPEFYDHLPYHDSYLKVFWAYITDPSMGPFSRVIRYSKGGKTQ